MTGDQKDQIVKDNLNLIDINQEFQIELDMCKKALGKCKRIADRMDDDAHNMTDMGHAWIAAEHVMVYARKMHEAIAVIDTKQEEVKQEEMTTCSAYDLISEEDRETLRWVKEMSGLEHVKDLFYGNVQVSGDPAEWKREVYELCEYIGVHHEDCDGEEDMLKKAYELLGKRLMPEGYEWPRYDDGEMVTLGDNDSFEFYRKGIMHWHRGENPRGDKLQYGERVKRQEVLAADGEPLEVGQTVWHVQDGREYVVVEPSYGDTAVVRDARYHDAEGEQYAPDQLTHQRPVLDADDAIVNIGDTLWRLTDGKKFEVTAVDLKVRDIRVKDDSMKLGIWAIPRDFTHTKPETDSWEKIENDASLSPEVYCHRNGIDISQKDGTEIFLADTVEPMAHDLVRRCKALANKEN